VKIELTAIVHACHRRCWADGTQLWLPMLPCPVKLEFQFSYSVRNEVYGESATYAGFDAAGQSGEEEEDICRN
jgi:hypothetical protein